MRDAEFLKQEAQILQRPWNHPIGNFLSADFEQERETHWATSTATGAC
jgi:hypothetical protein